MAFSFGGGDTGSGFSFGNFGATTSGSTSTTAPAAGGFSFAAPSTSAPATGGFAFGAPAATTSTTTTAPASTGFAFGAPSTSNTTTSSALTSSLFSLSSTPASTTTTTTTTAPATTGFNFSFGGDTGATTTTTTSTIATTTAPAATAPLSFGFGDTGASTTTSTLPTFSLDTKPSTAPTTDAFSFAAPATTTSSSSSSSTTTTSTSSTSTTTTAGTIDPSSRIKNKTVDEIINLWSRDLEDHVQSFTEQAIEVKKWDTQMIENLNKIVKLQGSVTNVQSSQVKLNRILETIKINQQDLTTMIDNLEKAVDQTSKRNLTPDEMKREEAYRLAEEIDSQLMVMSDSLQETVRTLNTSAERHADPNNPFTQILKILNIQMTSLQWIEQTSQQLEGELSQAQQVVRTAKADTRTTSSALNGYRR